MATGPWVFKLKVEVNNFQLKAINLCELDIPHFFVMSLSSCLNAHYGRNGKELSDVGNAMVEDIWDEMAYVNAEIIDIKEFAKACKRKMDTKKREKEAILRTDKFAKRIKLCGESKA